MQITKIQNIYQVNNIKQSTQKNQQSAKSQNVIENNIDWRKSIPLQNSFINIIKPNININFTGGVSEISYAFEQKFSRTFFKKLLREGIPDAYGEKILISREDIDTLKQMGLFNKKSSTAIKYLKDYKEMLFNIEKEIFSILETLSKKHPDLTLQELLKLKYDAAEKTLITQQTKILDKLGLMIRQLPRDEYNKVRKLLNESFDRIFEPNPLPENRFGRKNFLYALDKIQISDESIKTKLMKVAEKLPQSSDSISAFIIKYSQPYKFKYHHATDTVTKIPRTSEDIALRLLEPSQGTDEHIYAKTRYKQEAEARKNGEEYAKGLSDYRVTILTSQKLNGIKTDDLIDDFILKQDKNIPKHIQNHINRLLDIFEKWVNNGKLQDAHLLGEYIVVLRDEFALRSKLVKINIGDIEEKLPQLQQRIIENKAKHIAAKAKRTARADNNHKDHNTTNKGHQIENRKLQIHGPKFSQ